MSRRTMNMNLCVSTSFALLAFLCPCNEAFSTVRVLRQPKKLHSQSRRNRAPRTDRPSVSSSSSSFSKIQYSSLSSRSAFTTTRTTTTTTSTKLSVVPFHHPEFMDTMSHAISSAVDIPTWNPSEMIDGAISTTENLSEIINPTTPPGGEEELASLGRDIFIFLMSTVAVVPISRALKVTPVLGFLAVGCLIGPYGIDLFDNTEADLTLGDFGILFLLFNEGLALSPDRIKKLTTFSTLGIFQLMLSIALFFFGTIFGGPLILKYVAEIGIPLDDKLLRPILDSPVEAFCIASAGALSSSAFVLPVLKEKKWESRKEGIAGLSILLLQDLAVAPLLVILPLLAGSGPQTSMELGILVAKATFGFGAVLAVGSYALRYVFDVVAAARSTETFVAAALLVAVGMGQAADSLGLSPSTGAFAAGVLLAGNRYRAQIQADIKPFEGILLGIFFLTAGANLDPQLCIQEWPTLTVGIAAFIVTKAAILFAEGPALGLSRGEAARVALTLSGGGEFSFVLFKLAEDLDVLPDALAKLLTASVVISMSLTPLLGELGDKAGNYLDYLDDVNPVEDGGMTPQEAEALFQEIDADDSGTIEIDELRTALVSKGLHYVAIAEIFTGFDTNGDGSICKAEWEEGLKAGVLESALLNDPIKNAESEKTFSEDAIVICGWGELGKATYEMIKATNVMNTGMDNNNVVAFDLNPSRVTAGVMSGAPVVFGDGAKIDLLKAAGVNTPRAVIVTFASDARELDATMRLREALPAGTPIYARARNSKGAQALLAAGATEVIMERTESILRIGDVLGVINSPEQTQQLRSAAIASSTEFEAVPGMTEEALYDLATEMGCTRTDLARLYTMFSSLPENVGGDVPIAELRDMVLRTAGDGPIDADALTKCMERADDDGSGSLTFEEFVRVSCRPTM